MKKFLILFTLLVYATLNISCGEEKKKVDNKEDFICAREELETDGWSFIGEVRFYFWFGDEQGNDLSFSIYEKNGNYIRVDKDLLNNYSLETLRDGGFIQSVTRGNFYKNGEYYTWSGPNSYGR